MKHVRLGRSGLMVSRVCLGSMTFGVQCDEEASRSVLDRAAEGGVTFLDTADVYPGGGDADTVGLTEQILGRWLKGRREHFVIATKGYHPTGPNAWDKGNSRKHLLDAVDASLRRLGSDYIDLYQLHRYDDETPIDETLSALDSVVRSGKVRYVGVSNWPAWRLALALGRSDVHASVRFDSVQPRYNLLFRDLERELFPLCKAEGIGVLPYNPMAGGLLSGKHVREAPPPRGTRFTLGSSGPRYQDRYWNDRSFDAVDAIKRIAGAAGIALPTLAVAWVLANPVVSAAIIGASRPEQLDATLAAVDLELEPDLLDQLDNVTRRFRFGDSPD